MADRRNFKPQGTNHIGAFMTVHEAADVLRIGEALAYRMANEFLQSGGACGIPCVRLGRRLLVSRKGLERLAAPGVEAS